MFEYLESLGIDGMQVLWGVDFEGASEVSVFESRGFCIAQKVVFPYCWISGYIDHLLVAVGAVAVRASGSLELDFSDVAAVV